MVYILYHGKGMEKRWAGPCGQDRPETAIHPIFTMVRGWKKIDGTLRAGPPETS